LIRVTTRESVESQNIDPVDAAASYCIAQSFECRSNQRRAAIPVVDEDVVRLQCNLVVLGSLLQRRYLAANGIATCLLVA
jgi:hypothetical protein